ncbi:MAG: hypothetical protein CR986_03230 [Ignavibacteriae bacterium]|nr:MAG: hypothetical protein CR986_03230 [Ignavibacteriota bacterium]
MKKNKWIFGLIFFIAVLLSAQDTSQTFLSLKNTSVKSFQDKYPEYDGKGTIVLVLDTGVDMGIDGLTKTSAGEVKVIDVQDFTGQGDVKFYEAEIDEEDNEHFFINEEHALKIKGADKLKYKAADGKYYIGAIEESLWKNSGSRANDVNGNGNDNDKFEFVTFKVNENGEVFWVVYIDTNNNEDLSDEKPLRNYKEKNDTFTFENNETLPPFTIALNIFDEREIVSFFFDDGSHGTHCAGISAGNKIGNTNLNGIAPGAYVMGFKLGNNNLAGGATVTESMKKCFLYADKISKEREEPCIINLSFGIGSEIEGKADIENFIKNLVEENPYLYIATSNGNEGPGLSNAGMPSASEYIFSTGAVLAQEVGNDLYGTTLDRDIILHFSSRGGEVLKPDVVAPGACVSTVPNFSRGDRFWGTSMASPYSAGVMSVLLGALKTEYPDVKIPSRLLYRVLRETAEPMEGYDFVDQGGGLINIEAAYNKLKKIIKNKEISNFETYSIESFAPNMPEATAPNLYIRDGSFLSGDEKFSFIIKRDDTNKNKKFYRIFNLSTDADWLKIINKKIHLRNNQPTMVKVQLADSILTEPGLYNAEIKASRAGKTKMYEFSMMATVVIPYQFSSKNNYKLNFDDQVVEPGMHKRYFLKIPNGSSNLNIQVTSDNKEFTAVRYYLHDPDGIQRLRGYLNTKSDSGSKVEHFSDLQPGVYEFIILGEFTSQKESKFNLSFEIDGIELLNNTLNKKNEIEVVNNFSKIKRYSIDGKLLGYQKKYTVELENQTNYEIPFTLTKGEAAKSFEISLSKEDYNKVTDFALMIYNTEGKSVNIGGLSSSKSEISVSNIADTTQNYTFEFIPAFAEKPSKMEVNITEKTYFKNKVNLNALINGSNKILLYPNIKQKVSFSFDKPEQTIPENNLYFGEIEFKALKTKDVELTKTILIK